MLAVRTWADACGVTGVPLALAVPAAEPATPSSSRTFHGLWLNLRLLVAFYRSTGVQFNNHQ